MGNVVEVLFVIVLAVITLYTLACLLFPQLHLRIQRAIRPSEIHFENERPDRGRQLAMIFILAMCIIMLVETLKCGR